VSRVRKQKCDIREWAIESERLTFNAMGCADGCDRWAFTGSSLIIDMDIALFRMRMYP